MTIKKMILNNTIAKIFIIVFTSVLIVNGAGDVKKLVFEEKMIEGKIRRPQLVLIKAETRPEFEPMVMKSVDKGMNVEEYTNGNSVEGSPHKGPFEMRDYNITNYEP